MARPTYSARGLVLRKTKLGEMDLIVTLLAQDGSQLRAVARGARKPGGSLSGKMELCNTVDMLCSKGASLDSITEARLVRSHPELLSDLTRASCASCIAELTERVTQVGLPHERLFDMVSAAVDGVAAAPSAEVALSVCAAALLKVFAFTGFAPQLTSCAVCGSPVDAARARVPFSMREGGVLCERCTGTAEWAPVSGVAIQLAGALLMSTFDAILAAEADEAATLAVLDLCGSWARFHVGSRLRSLDFLLTPPDIPA